jgi:hypothetical protein
MKLTVSELYNSSHVKIMRGISAICHQIGLGEEPRPPLEARDVEVRGMSRRTSATL